MNTVLVDGLGSGYPAQVDNTNRLRTSTLGSMAITSYNAWAGTGSVYVAGGSVSINVGDIQIGAVELKNQANDDRATIIGSALWVSLPTSTNTTGSIGAITSGTVATIITQNVAGSTIILGWNATSTADSQITLLKDTTRLQTKRINIFSERNVGESFISPIIIAAGSIVIQAVHAETISQSYEANVWYRVV